MVSEAPLFGLNAFNGIRDPDSMPYVMRRGVASMLYKANGSKAYSYTGLRAKEEFTKAYNIVGASLVRSGILKKSESERNGSLVLGAYGVRRTRELKEPTTPGLRKRLRRAKVALAVLDNLLETLQSDLASGVIKEN